MNLLLLANLNSDPRGKKILGNVVYSLPTLVHHNEVQMDKLWNIHPIEYHIKTQLHTTWMNLTNLMERYMTHKASFKQEFLVYDSTM